MGKGIELLGEWITPPEEMGQIVTDQYNYTEDYILIRTIDRSDGSVLIKAFAYPDDGDYHGMSDPCSYPILGKFISDVSID